MKEDLGGVRFWGNKREEAERNVERRPGKSESEEILVGLKTLKMGWNGFVGEGRKVDGKGISGDLWCF